MRGASALALAPLGIFTALGCASTRSNEPEPEPPAPTPLPGVALLPSAPAPGLQGSGFGAGTILLPIPTGSGGPTSGDLAFTLVATLIATGIQHSRLREKQALRRALDAVRFDPLSRLDLQLASLLPSADLLVAPISDRDSARSLRAGDTHQLPAGNDALLDVVVHDCGYYSSMRAGGYSPMLQLSATLRRPGAGSEEEPLDSFDYYADYRNGGGDRRWVTTPSSATYPSTEALEQSADAARAALESTIDRIAALIAEDVQRHAGGLPRRD